MWSQSHRYFVKTTKFETSQKNPSLRKFSLRFWPRLKSLINFPMNGAGFMILVLAGCKKGLVHVVDISKMELKPISPIDFIWFSECHLGYLLFDFMAKKHHSLITITLKAMKIFCWLLSTPPGQNSAGLALHTWPNKTKSVEKLCSEKKFIKVLRIYNFSDTSNSNQKWKKPPHSKKKKEVQCPKKSLLLRTWELFESPHHRYDWSLSIPWQNNIDRKDGQNPTCFNGAKLQFPPPSADSLSTTVTRKFAKKCQNSQISCCHASKKPMISDSRQHPHIALPKRKTRS